MLTKIRERFSLTRMRERFSFVALILFGFVLCFFLVPKARNYVCPSAQDSIRVEYHQYPTSKHGWQSQQVGEYAYRYANYSDQQSEKSDPIQIVLCGEMKLTDLALVFFTYCLAVVGWFTLRSNERNTERLERAYVFPGYSPLRFRNNKVFFTLVMTNTGRMPGIIKEVGYAFLKRERLPRWRWQRDWQWEKMPYDWLIPIKTRREIKPLKSEPDDNIFVMYIRYRDMFSRKTHHSWMGMYLYQGKRPDQPDNRAGGDVWNAWD